MLAGISVVYYTQLGRSNVKGVVEDVVAQTDVGTTTMINSFTLNNGIDMLGVTWCQAMWLTA